MRAFGSYQQTLKVSLISASITATVVANILLLLFFVVVINMFTTMIILFVFSICSRGCSLELQLQMLVSIKSSTFGA